MRTRIVLCLVIVFVLLGNSQPLQAQADEHYFSETGFSVGGKFLTYWQSHGDLARFGYPISAEIRETSTLDGKPYTVQYFERAEFELHPENKAPYDVLLSQLGTFHFHLKYPSDPPNQQVDTINPNPFAETGHTIGGRFRDYWAAHGGLASFGYPLTDEFAEKSDLNGRYYQVQYFERAVFEYHPENATPNDVLLSQLGRFLYDQKYNHKFTIPAQRGRIFGMKASPDYVVWLEDTNNPKTSHLLFSYDIRAQQITTLTTMARDYISIDGSIVWWEELSGGNNIGGVRAIIGEDLTTGKQMSLSTDGKSEYSYPASYGRTLAWIKWDNNQINLITMNLDSGQVNEIAKLSSINPLAISEKYIVWSELDSKQYGYEACQIFAYDRAKGSSRAVSSGLGEPPCQYSLEGSSLVWTTALGGAFQQSLDTDSKPVALPFFGVDPMIRDNIIVWSGSGRGPNAPQGIWGLHVGEASPHLLVSSKDNLSNPQIAGDALIYQGKGGIVSVPLADTFAATINADPPSSKLAVNSFGELSRVVGNASADHKISGENILYISQPDRNSPVEAYGYNLRSQQVFTSAGALANGVDANDSVLLWKQHPEQNNCSPNCPSTLVGEDILTGQRYDLGEVSLMYTTHGHSAAWVKSDKNAQGYESADIYYENLDSGQVTLVMSGTYRVNGVAVSDNYVAWQDSTAVRAYNLKTRVTRTLAEDAPRYSAGFALDSSQLIWTNEISLFYTNLDSDAPPVKLYDKQSEAVSIKGDYVLWSSNGGYGECGPCDIWGMKLSQRLALPLITGYTDIYGGQIAGDYLVWTDLNASRTLYTPLADAFAAAGD